MKASRTPTFAVLALLVLGVNVQAQRAARPSAEELSRRAESRASADRVAWEGTYTFQEGGGRTAGGTGMFVEHTIKVYRRGEGLIAEVDAAGFQVSISLRCAAKAEGARLNIYFESYREGNITEPYRRGQLLLSLERSTYRSKARILTYWAAYRPAFQTPKSGRVYFRKTG